MSQENTNNHKSNPFEFKENSNTSNNKQIETIVTQNSNNRVEDKEDYEISNKDRQLMRKSILEIEKTGISADSTLPKYVPISFRGAGAFGYVVEAYDAKNDCRVAIKRTHKVGKKLSREYRILSELKGCPNTVEMLDTFYTINDEGAVVQNVVFEYVSNSLENEIERLKQEKNFFDYKELKSIFRQLLDGLVFCRKKSIVHRDLKPENVLYTSDKRVKICDFGSSKMIFKKGEEKGNNEVESSQVVDDGIMRNAQKESNYFSNISTLNTSITGKPASINFNKSSTNNNKYYDKNNVVTRSTPYIVSRYYRSPELILGCDSYDSSIDIFATGCIFFELCSLTPLFPGRAEGMQLFEQMTILGGMPKGYLSSFPAGKLLMDLVDSIKSIQTCDLVDLMKVNFHLSNEMLKDLRDLILKMICWWPHERLTAEEALKHPFFTKEYK